MSRDKIPSASGEAKADGCLSPSLDRDDDPHHSVSSPIEIGPQAAVRLLALLGLALLITTSILFAQPLPPDQCYHASLSSALLWTTSGAPTHDVEPGAWVVDAVDKKIFRIDQRGWVEVDPAKNTAAHQLSNPRQIRATDRGYLLLRIARTTKPDGTLEQAPEIYRFDHELADPVPIALPKEVVAIWDFVSLGDGVLAFGDFNEPKPFAALFYASPDGGRQIFHRYPLLNEDGTLNEAVFAYTTDNTSRFLATLDRVGYMLFREPSSRIGRVEIGAEGVTYLSGFPHDFRAFPNVASRTAWREATSAFGRTKAYFEIVEKSKLAASLFAGHEGGEEYLYLLVKDARHYETGTPWWLVKLDPENGEAVARLSLPTSRMAAHLTVIPNSDGFWTLIERRNVIGLRGGSNIVPYMKTASMTLLPSTWLRDPDIARKATADCRSLNLR